MSNAAFKSRSRPTEVTIGRFRGIQIKRASSEVVFIAVRANGYFVEGNGLGSTQPSHSGCRLVLNIAV